MKEDIDARKIVIISISVVFLGLLGFIAKETYDSLKTTREPIR